MPWPIPQEEELLETLQRFKAVDEAQTGTINFEQYMQVAIGPGGLVMHNIIDLRNVLFTDVMTDVLGQGLLFGSSQLNSTDYLKTSSESLASILKESVRENQTH